MLALALLGTAAAQTAPAAADGFTPKWVESSLHEVGLGYRPNSIVFTPALAAEVKKAPGDLAAPHYGSYHDKGLEVLGISLDKEGMAEKLAACTTKKGMPWPQVYDGGFWSAGVAKAYEIHAIPHMLLVDGDTGIILANKTIRGEALAPAIEKALAYKKN